MLFRRLLVVGLIIWCGYQPAVAQSLDGALLLMRRSAQGIADRAGTGPSRFPELEVRSRQLLNQLSELEDRLGSGARPPSTGYVLTLQSDASALAAAAQADPPTALAVVADVSADLGVKLNAARAGLGLAATAGIDVQVEVSTMRGQQKVDGFLVHANPIRYRDAEPMFPFGNPSSPAVKQLAPGRYVITARKTGSNDAKQTYDIGSGGERSAPLKLLVE